MNEKTDRQVKMERNESEISQGGVFYSCVHEACQQVAPKIFKWLGLASTPELLSPGMQNFATIIILQCDRGRALDDITAVHNEYLRYQGQKIIILSLSIHDAEDHTKRYCTENISTDGSITFLKIHQRANGHIHECRGNQFCRETVQSLLGIAKQKDDQSHRKKGDDSSSNLAWWQWALLILTFPFVIIIFAFAAVVICMVWPFSKQMRRKTFLGIICSIWRFLCCMTDISPQSEGKE